MSLVSRPSRLLDPFFSEFSDPAAVDPFFNEPLWPSTTRSRLWPTLITGGRMWPSTSLMQSMIPIISQMMVRDIIPRLDYEEHLDRIQVKMVLPGYTQNDIKVNLNNGILTVVGDRQQASEEPWVYERQSRFNQQLRLPSYADEENCRAEIINGVLNINIGKKEFGRNITVN